MDEDYYFILFQALTKNIKRLARSHHCTGLINPYTQKTNKNFNAYRDRIMSEAYIIDAIRTPRGKGKKDGSLHQVKPISLLTGLLNELLSRHLFDTSAVDDIVLGCVTPIGDQGADIAKTAAIAAGWDNDVAAFKLTAFVHLV